MKILIKFILTVRRLAVLTNFLLPIFLARKSLVKHGNDALQEGLRAATSEGRMDERTEVASGH